MSPEGWHSSMYHPRHARPHRYLVPVAVAALVAVVAGLSFGLDGQRDVAEAPQRPDGHTDAPGSAGPDGFAADSPGPDDEGSESDVPVTSREPAPLDQCRTQYDAQSPLLRTGSRSIKQWELHVVAMNQLVAGEITLEQASAFWNRTRIGAQGRVADFRKADHAYAARSYDCPTRRGSDTEPVAACAHSVALRDKVLSVARRSIDTWDAHVRDMELLREGRLSPARATEMWQMNWQMGQHQIDSYHGALRRSTRADRAGACTG
jgi:hypothetical protein